MSVRDFDGPALAATRRPLTADCGRCAGLCCVAPAVVASADFAINKPAGEPCTNLLADFSCGIHERLRERGFPGCAVFDCFGAGQQVTQVTFSGQNWQQKPEIASSMFAVFAVMRQLRELQWYLIEARALYPEGPLRSELDNAWDRTDRLTSAGPDELSGFDAAAYRQDVGRLLAQVSEQVRSALRPAPPEHRSADLIGAKLTRADLRAACLRGAYLIGTELRGADLRGADFLGADLRAADLRGANLDDAIFLTQPQLEAAQGDATTTIPASLARPAHWAVPSRRRTRQ